MMNAKDSTMPAPPQLFERLVQILEHAGDPARAGFTAQSVQARVAEIHAAARAGDWRTVVTLKIHLYDSFLSAALNRNQSTGDTWAQSLANLKTILERGNAPAASVTALVNTLAAAKVLQLMALIVNIADCAAGPWRDAAREVLKAQLIAGVPEQADRDRCLACGSPVDASESHCSGCGATLAEQRE